MTNQAIHRNIVNELFIVRASIKKINKRYQFVISNPYSYSPFISTILFLWYILLLFNTFLCTRICLFCVEWKQIVVYGVRGKKKDSIAIDDIMLSDNCGPSPPATGQPTPPPPTGQPSPPPPNTPSVPGTSPPGKEKNVFFNIFLNYRRNQQCCQ